MARQRASFAWLTRSLSLVFTLLLDVIKPNAGADEEYDKTALTVRRIERELEVHLRDMELLFKGKVTDTGCFVLFLPRMVLYQRSRSRICARFNACLVCCLAMIVTLIFVQCKLTYYQPGVSNEKYQIQVRTFSIPISLRGKSECSFTNHGFAWTCRLRLHRTILSPTIGLSNLTPR